LGGGGVGVGEGKQGGGFEDALGLGVVGAGWVCGDAATGGDLTFMSFMAPTSDLTFFEHLLSASRRNYYLYSYLNYSKYKTKKIYLFDLNFKKYIAAEFIIEIIGPHMARYGANNVIIIIGNISIAVALTERFVIHK
jgi:hypothetical protein